MDLDNKPTIWLVSWNPKRTPDFDLDEVFANNDVIDWWKVPAMKSAKVGDIVYLYASAPQMAIRYKCEIIDTDFIIKDMPKNEEALDENEKPDETSCFLFKMIQGYTYGYCPLEKMKEYGVKPTSLVGPHRLKPEEDEKIAEMIDYLDHVQTPDIDPNVILYGPPGTGKTYNSVLYADAILDLPVRSGGEELAKALKMRRGMDYADMLADFNQHKAEAGIFFVTFHQSYGYEDFIEGIRPVTEDGKISYVMQDGIFKEACREARRLSDLPVVMIIDEINRGNVSKIFGELITLLEKSKRAGAEEAMTAVLSGSKEVFSVPKNLFIIGTMNTADRSIALMDTALRRRFSFVEMMPTPELLDDVVVSSDSVQVNVGELLRTINHRIEVLYDREHTIGHSYFMKLRKEPTLENLAQIFKEKVIPLLQEYFYEDYSRIQLVLGDNAKSDPAYQLIEGMPVKAKKLFKGMVDIDLPEMEYHVQEGAFLHLESFAEIMNP